jgi:molecular chaperone DnaJ
MAPDLAHYYRVLGLSPNAPGDAVKKAFRGLAQEWHPDVSDDPRAEVRFREIVEAYEALSHPLRRELRERAHAARAPRPRRPVPRPPDAELVVSYVAARRGCERAVELPTAVTCPACRGEGAAPWAEPRLCSACDGDGWVRRVSTSDARRWIQVDACPECAGAGVVVSEPCPDCRGTGRLERIARVTVRVPPNALSGARLTATGRTPGGDPIASVVVRVEAPPSARALRALALAGVALGVLLVVLMLRPF